MYDLPEDLRIELTKCNFSKNYFNDTVNLIMEALAKAYKAGMFIHVNGIQQHPENSVAVDFPSIIHLIKTGQNYNLLKQIMNVDDVPWNEEGKEESDGDCSKK